MYVHPQNVVQQQRNMAEVNEMLHKISLMQMLVNDSDYTDKTLITNKDSFRMEYDMVFKHIPGAHQDSVKAYRKLGPLLTHCISAYIYDKFLGSNAFYKTAESSDDFYQFINMFVEINHNDGPNTYTITAYNNIHNEELVINEEYKHESFSNDEQQFILKKYRNYFTLENDVDEENIMKDNKRPLNISQNGGILPGPDQAVAMNELYNYIKMNNYTNDYVRQFAKDDTSHDFSKFKLSKDGTLLPHVNENIYINNVIDNVNLQGEIYTLVLSSTDLKYLKNKATANKLTEDNTDFFNYISEYYLYDMGHLNCVLENLNIHRVHNLSTIIDGQGCASIKNKDYKKIFNSSQNVYTDLDEYQYVELYKTIFKENNIDEKILKYFKIKEHIHKEKRIFKIVVGIPPPPPPQLPPSSPVEIIFNDVDNYRHSFVIRTIVRKIKQYLDFNTSIITQINGIEKKDSFDEFFVELDKSRTTNGEDSLKRDDIINILYSFKLIGDRGQALTVKKLNEKNGNKECILLSGDRMCVAYAMMKHVPVMYYSPSKETIFLYKPRELFKFRIQTSNNTSGWWNTHLGDEKYFLIKDKLIQKLRLYKKIKDKNFTFKDIKLILETRLALEVVGTKFFGWFGKIMLDTIIDYITKNINNKVSEILIQAGEGNHDSILRADQNGIIDDLDAKKIINGVKGNYIVKYKKSVKDYYVKKKMENLELFDEDLTTLREFLKQFINQNLLQLQTQYARSFAMSPPNPNNVSENLKIQSLVKTGLCNDILIYIEYPDQVDQDDNNEFMNSFKNLIHEKCEAYIRTDMFDLIKTNDSTVDNFTKAFEQDPDSQQFDENGAKVNFDPNKHKATPSYKNLSLYCDKLAEIAAEIAPAASSSSSSPAASAGPSSVP